MRTTILGLLAILIGAAGAEADDRHHVPNVPDDARFAFLKQLEGTWVGQGLDNEPDGVYEFAVTAGGTAVREIEMKGTPMEMVTLYYMEGPDLVATHYCMLGNRPRLAANKPIAGGTLTFDCAGIPGNAKSHAEHHVHGWAMKIAEDGRLHYSAELIENGEVTHAPALILTRQERTPAADE